MSRFDGKAARNLTRWLQQRSRGSRKWRTLTRPHSASTREAHMKSIMLLDILSLLSLLLLSACAPLAQPEWKDVRLPPKRLALKGYSLLPPNEKGWRLLNSTRSPNHLTLVKHRSENDDESIVIEATSIQYPENSQFQFNEEILKLIRESNAKKLKDSPRYKRLKEELALSREQGMECIRGYSVDEDHEAAPIKISGTGGYMILELAYISCFHPKDRLTGIRVNYSQRYYLNHQDPNFLDKANAIFNTIEPINP